MRARVRAGLHCLDGLGGGGRESRPVSITKPGWPGHFLSLLPPLALQVLLTASTIVSAPAQDRDFFFGWVRAWRGIR